MAMGRLPELMAVESNPIFCFKILIFMDTQLEARIVKEKGNPAIKEALFKKNGVEVKIF